MTSTKLLTGGEHDYAWGSNVVYVYCFPEALSNIVFVCVCFVFCQQRCQVSSV